MYGVMPRLRPPRSLPLPVDGSDPAAVKRRSGSGPTAFVSAAIVGASVRFWLVVGKPPSWWQDSADYAVSAQAGLLSSDLWLGSRPPVMPLLLGLSGGEPGRSFVIVQVVIAAACWAWLATELAVSMASTRWGSVAAVVIVGFSLTEPVAMWDRQVLTESLTLAFLAATCAGVLCFCRSQTAITGGILLAICLVWGLTRDSVAVTLVVAGLASAVGVRRHRVAWAVGLGVVAIGLVTGSAATYADRGQVPLSHVYFARVLPFPDRVAWFEARGMPQAIEMDARSSAPAPPGEPKVTAFAEDDPAFAAWWQWFDQHGASRWRSYVVAHPWYLVTEPMREPERVYNNAEGSIAFYRPVDMVHIPLTTSLLWPSMTAALVGLAGLAHIARKRSLVGPPVVLAGLLVVGAAAYALVAWHSDAMESARHVFISGAMTRLALILAVVGVFDARSRSVAARTAPDLEAPFRRGVVRGSMSSTADPLEQAVSCEPCSR